MVDFLLQMWHLPHCFCPHCFCSIAFGEATRVIGVAEEMVQGGPAWWPGEVQQYRDLFRCAEAEFANLPRAEEGRHRQGGSAWNASTYEGRACPAEHSG
jgi:hypothetical protein